MKETIRQSDKQSSQTGRQVDRQTGRRQGLELMLSASLGMSGPTGLSGVRRNIVGRIEGS